MPAVCRSCGAYAATLRGCGECGVVDAISVMPVLVLTGACGVGKTSIVGPLQAALSDVNVFDTDALLGLNQYGERVEWDAWLTVAHAGAQVGRATLLSGTALPEWFDELPARETVGPIHFALLHCDDETRAGRLRGRPAWRQSSSPEFIQAHKDFAAHLLERGWPVFDTSIESAETTSQSVAAWARSVIDSD
jgi:hypothetical protein